MEKLFLKKKVPKLLIVEGFWGTGKTNFINNVSRLGVYKIISEPNHINSIVNVNVSKWYFNEHKKILHSVKKDLKKEKIIMERSIISNAAYQYAREGTFDSIKFLKLFNMIKSTKDFIILFFNVDELFFKNRIKNINDIETKNLLFNSDHFYKRYNEFYKKILPKYIDRKIIYLKVNNKKKFKDINNLILLFLKNFQEKNKIKSICAASLAYYKNKVLLLYDYNYKHYVLPQGHKKDKEKLTDAALRELSEETGYIYCRLVKKIKKYHYSYYRNDILIYKEVHVFLVEIINKKRASKKLEAHENYSNHFFNVNEAIKKARWKEDKDIIKLSKPFINKKAPIYKY